MIYVVTGKVGEGKSYHVFTLMVRHMLAGGVVATNMSVDLDRMRSNFKRRFAAWQLIKIDATSDPRTIPHGDFRGAGRRKVMVVLDEALNWFASQGGSKDERKATWGEWLRQSDKLGQEVYFIAQSFERAAKWIRELSQIALNICNFKSITFLRLPIGKWFHLESLYGVSTYDVRSQILLSWWCYQIKPQYYECYRTAELFGFSPGEAGYIATLPPPFRLPFWPFLLPLSLAILGVLYASFA